MDLHGSFQGISQHASKRAKMVGFSSDPALLERTLYAIPTRSDSRKTGLRTFKIAKKKMGPWSAQNLIIGVRRISRTTIMVGYVSVTGLEFVSALR